jgi:NADPH2:quinone reductase
MRAIVAREIGSLEKLAIEELPTPQAGAGEVVVDMKVAAVNFPDLLVVEGKYQSIPPTPFVPGMEGAGVVAATGAGVTGLNAGDRVMVQAGHGAFAEKVAVKADRCYPMPAGIGFDAAAAIGIAYQTAHFSLVARAGLKKGETVLVTGASGSVGIAALQLAKAFGGRTIAGLSTMAKEAVARENGADHVIDLAKGNPRDAIRDQVKAATGGGVDVVVDMVGGDVFEGGLRALNWDGRMVVVGFTSGAIPSMKINYVLLKNIAVTGVNWSGYRERDPARVLRVQDEIWTLYAERKIRVPVQARFALKDFPAAFAVIRNREVRGKVVLDLAGTA